MSESTDFLVIGSGIAGLRAAIALAPAGRVLILAKGAPAESNTGYAQGGIAAALGADDSPALHAADTIRAGDGLCDERAVAVLVEEGPAYVRELVDWGARFDRDERGQLAFAREAAHSVRRVLHAGDATGREIGRALWAHASALPPISTMAHAVVASLIVENGAVEGARWFDPDGKPHEIRARATLLATGGAGRVFRETTNPPIASGDGIAMAYRAGAQVADAEFVQFHPTAFSRPGAPRFLLSEALRGDGARLVNAAGEPFMPRYHPDADLAPRDVVARSIVREERRTGGRVFLTLAHLDADAVRRRFPSIAGMCAQYGLDLAIDPIPVRPAAHYIMGGVATDVDGRTSLPGLFAAGEAACTGVHGANRLASNSLLEGLVFGARAARAMRGGTAVVPHLETTVYSAADDASTFGVAGRPARPHEEARRPASSRGEVSHARSVPDLMWEDVGLFRTRQGLERAVGELTRHVAASAAHVARAPDDGDAWRGHNLATVALLIARAALRREESRGAHFREDFPARDDGRWRVHAADLLAGYN